MTQDVAVPPKRLFKHIFGDLEGVLVTLTARQARLDDPDARDNELTGIRHDFYAYPRHAGTASDAFIEEAADRGRDCYFGVHLFRERGNRRAANSVATVHALWLDEDEGAYPAEGPPPTAVINSSADRRHLYWRLTCPISVEWAVSINKRIAHWSGGDSGKAALASVLRPPSTLNFKRHPQIDPVTAEINDAAWEPEVLEQAVPPLPETQTSGPRGEYDGPEIDLADYLANPQLEVIGELPDGLGVKFAVVCPWVDEHSGGDRTGTRVGQREGGGPWFHCDHDHCQGRGWREFKHKLIRVGRLMVTI